MITSSTQVAAGSNLITALASCASCSNASGTLEKKSSARSAGMRFAVYRGNMQADLQLTNHTELVELLIGAVEYGAHRERKS